MARKSKGELSFEDSMDRLEEIVRIMERGDAPLEESLKLLEEGTALVRRCSKLLDTAQTKITIVSEGENGEPVEKEADLDV